ncbi:transmembrane 7 superfamily member 3 isoform X2 [Perognathus longimembris pacificus]|uniref:transmembrane 7 superfamily member 3 isoform X2 n=1 Tax=Perognathus longimembris pacificus TaxID=214514 RepID=UPI0020192388|nr:transmembrane 7 superfamily member 3 isoform X2 [Perognathus longimembris pacificus]
MQVLWLLILAVLVAQRGTTSVAEVFGNASTGLLEFSVGKFRYFELNRLFPKEAILHHISTNVTFLLFQIHSQYQNTTLSFSKTILPNTSGTGSDRGLVFILRPEQTVCTWHLETLEEKPVYNMAIPLSYSERDPVPGGCNLEFDLDIDPNIYLEYNFFEMRIKFAPANVGFARGVVPPPCDTEEGQDFRWRLQYDVYQYFLPENDLTEDALLQHLQRMAQVPQVRANAVKVVTLTANDKTEVSFSSLLGQGVIYNVIVWDPFFNTYAAYVPVHTYACSFEAVEGSCASLELFFIGFIFLGFFFYILIARLTSMKYDVLLILTALAGSIGGVFLVATWWRFGVLMFCMLCVGLVLGFLTSSMTFFTPLGNLKVFRDDGVFWMTFSCIAILIPVVFMGCLRILNILTCGIIGSYSVVLAIGSYVFTSLSSITVNVLRRALDANFNKAFTSVPFQTNDFVVLAIWGMLAVSGITLQIRRERGQPFFPPHPYKLWKQERERRVTNILDPSHHILPLRNRLWDQFTRIREFFQKPQPAGERTPLLL